MKKRILMSAYRCSPYDISEALAAFRWLEILLTKYEIVLATTEENKQCIDHYFSGKNVPLEFISFQDRYPLKNKPIVRDSIKLGYFIFNSKLEKYLLNNKTVLADVDVLFQKSPSSYRFVSCLYKFDKPFVIGPIGGGIKPPSPIRQYFRKESILYQLRKLDSILFYSKSFNAQFSKANKILLTLDYLRDILPEKYSEKYVSILDTGIHCEEYSVPIDKLDSDGRVKLLFVGRLVRYKGAELLIKAFEKIPDKERFDLVFIGDGEERKHLERYVKNNQLEDFILFKGNVPHDEVKQYYQNADIFCFPTLKEASGNALLEAMSSALPIITVDNGGPKYMCTDEGAIKVKVSSINDMIEQIRNAVVRLGSDNNLKLKMGHANRKHCENLYDWHVITKKIFNVFDNL